MDGIRPQANRSNLFWLDFQDFGRCFFRNKPSKWIYLQGWTLTEVSERAKIHYSTLKNYARSPGLATVDVTYLQKLARTFDLSIEDLFDVVKD